MFAVAKVDRIHLVEPNRMNRKRGDMTVIMLDDGIRRIAVRRFGGGHTGHRSMPGREPGDLAAPVSIRRWPIARMVFGHQPVEAGTCRDAVPFGDRDTSKEDWNVDRGQVSPGRTPGSDGRDLRSPPGIGGHRREKSGAAEAIAEDGYLYLPGYLAGKWAGARRGSSAVFMTWATGSGSTVDGRRISEQYRARRQSYANPNSEIDQAHQALRNVLYDGRMIDFYRMLFEEKVRAFDFTWHRAKTDSQETASNPHCDIVFMGRGSHRLCTSWTPLGDIPTEMGGLIVLEGSSHLDHVKSTYGTLDVDRYCTNYDDAAEIEEGTKVWQDWVKNGAYNNNAFETRQELGGRWLTTDYAAGDLLVFSMFTMHASMDNHTDRFRLSTDTRYQPASEPVDERWIGDEPIAHGPDGKVGLIC